MSIRSPVQSSPRSGCNSDVAPSVFHDATWHPRHQPILNPLRLFMGKNNYVLRLSLPLTCMLHYSISFLKILLTFKISSTLIKLYDGTDKIPITIAMIKLLKSYLPECNTGNTPL